MNKGISIANTEYINFINSGDIINGNYALAFVNQLILKNCSVIDDRSIFILDCLTLKNDAATLIKGDTIKSKSDSLSSFLPHPSTFYNINSFDEVGQFNENNFIVSDYEWYMNALFFKRFRLIYFSFCYSVFYQDGISNMNTSKHKSEYKQILTDHFFIYQVKIFSSKKYKFFKDFKLFRFILSLTRFDKSVRLIKL
jgi:hypothetical protein